MEQGACYRFAEAEVMPLAEFEHAPDCFFPASWFRNNIFLDWRERILLHDALKILDNAMPLAWALARSPASISGLNVRVPVTESFRGFFQFTAALPQCKAALLPTLPTTIPRQCHNLTN
jgi:hypothetical protein